LSTGHRLTAALGACVAAAAVVPAAGAVPPFEFPPGIIEHEPSPPGFETGQACGVSPIGAHLAIRDALPELLGTGPGASEWRNFPPSEASCTGGG
jgi:hypothetical protein